MIHPSQNTGSKMKKKIVLAIAFLCTLWLGGTIHAWFFSPNTGVFLLSNNSSETITSAQVSVCGQTFNYNEMLNGEYGFSRYHVTSDSHYDVKVIFSSGRTIEDEIGYVTHGSDFLDIIEVLNNEIVHKQRTLPDKQ